MAFSLPTLNQSLPILQGIQSAQGMLQQALMNQGRLRQNQAAPELAQALLAQRQAQTGLTNARIPLMQAQTQSAQFEAEHAPEYLALKNLIAQNAIRRLEAQEGYNEIQRQKVPYYLGNVNARLLGTTPGKYASAHDKSLMASILAGQKGVAEQFADSVPQSPYDQSVYTGIPFSPESPPSAPSRYQVAPDVVEGAQTATTSELAKKTYTDRTLRQSKAANTLFKIADQIEETLPDVVKYIGPVGQAKLASDKLSAAFGGNRPALKNYELFTKKLIPEATADMMNYFGTNHTDSQYKQIKDTLQPEMLWTNPKLFQETWKQSIRYLKQVEDIVKAPIAEDLKRTRIDNLFEEEFKPIAQKVRNRKQPGNNLKLGSAPDAPSGGAVLMHTPDGKSYNIPESDVEEAMRAGLRRGR